MQLRFAEATRRAVEADEARFRERSYRPPARTTEAEPIVLAARGSKSGRLGSR
ncbi:MAG TPA: hypothetical protein VF170_17135 [Planctomycetaceae bacterium]